MMNHYDKNLDEHIMNLQDELDEAHRVLYARGGEYINYNMNSLPENDNLLVERWKPMIKHIKIEKQKVKCARHLEYAMRYTEAVSGKKHHPALSVLMPCIARMYD